MTLRMLDSINVGNLPGGADAYLGYTGGNWPTFAALQKRFPHAHLLSMAVFASDDAEGCDCEAGDLAPAQVPGWLDRQLRRGVRRPVVYASASVMAAVLDAIERAGFRRADVRLLSAHYGAGKHICGPSTCAYPGVPACDGSQWRDDAAGVNGSRIDESILHDDFFDGGPVALTQADARTIWHADIIDSPTGKADTWTPATVLSDIDRMVRAVVVKVGADDAAIIAGVLKGLGPAGLAEAIATELGPDVGKQVVVALQAALAGAATS